MLLRKHSRDRSQGGWREGPKTGRSEKGLRQGERKWGNLGR